jgi:hypothetical protein
MESRRTAPYRRLPSRVRTSLNYLQFVVSVEQGCGRSQLSRELDQDETRTKRAALACLRGCMLGEQDHADVEIRESPDEYLDTEDALALFGPQEGPDEEQSCQL